METTGETMEAHVASNDPLREELVYQLERGNAHMSFEEAVADYPMERINTPFPNGRYTAWHLLEHLRLTQWDILDFIRNPHYQERAWPQDYWPPRDQQATPDEWQRTIHDFLADRQALRAIVMDPQTDLWAPIPQGTGQTIAREIMVVADHNAYHIGEFAIMRQVMGTWPSSHSTGG
ncbi:MAG TPA: DinB family protein [Ktedonobacterales bacterium]|nr:DinB family protein [Ktedonobacterales bacterium]